MDVVVEKTIVNREEVWRREGEKSTLIGLRGMTGSAFEAMDVVVAKRIVNREEVWRRDGEKFTRQEFWRGFPEPLKA